METVRYRIGNTYSRVPNRSVELDRSGSYRKVHDWILYCDILTGNPDYIQHVTFDMKSDTFSPQVFTCHCPVRTERGYWRFSTRQKTYGPVQPEVKIRPVGGKPEVMTWDLLLKEGGGRSVEREFVSRDAVLKTVKMVDEMFGVEFEMTSSRYDTKKLVADNIMRMSRIDVSVFVDYQQARDYNQGWKIMPDNSLVCSINQPDCNKFELVSPILQGGDGLGQINRVLRGLEGVNSLTVNKSAGFHVHINVQSMSLSSLKKVCQNFVKYEDAMDDIMPPSRRTRDPTPQNDYCKSNKLALYSCRTNRERNQTIDAVSSLEELCDVMNPNGDRYYKLNLQNLKTGRQQTVEFRQHSATVEYEKVSNWVRFCMSMVKNSGRLRAPNAFDEDTSLDSQFDMMFEYVIKDRCVRDYCRKRRVLLQGSSEKYASTNSTSSGGNCCNECTSESSHSVQRRYI